MASMNPGIILAGEPVSVLNSLAQGNEVAAQTQDIRQRNALNNLYRTQGAGILSGDQNALNALAGIDPMAALGVQSTQQGMRAREQEINIARENARLRALEHTASMDAATAQAEAAKLERGLAAATQVNDPQSWDALMQSFGLPDMVGRFAEKDILIASVLGLKDALEAQRGPEWRPATPEEAAAYGTTSGQFNTQTGKFERTPVDKGMRITSDGAGGFVLEEGPGVTNSGVGTKTDINPFTVETMTAEIDAIMKDPALARITGPIEGGGGNLVDDLNLGQRVYYGSAGLALIEKVGKLQGTTWLAARQFLKGGGPITDYESRKAESAISRLSRVKDEKEFKAALKDLRDAVVDGAAKLAARGGVGGSPQKSDGGTIPPAPAGIDGITPENWPDVWNAMSPEDKALFQ